VAAGLLIWNVRATDAAGTYEHARRLGKRCSTCHDSTKPHLANLNDAGRYFLEHRTLDGYKPGPSASSGGQPAGGAGSDPGLAVYTRACAVCHGPEGRGTALAAPLTGERNHARTEAEAVGVITNGIDGTAMTSFKSALSEREIRDVARYVMSLMPRRGDK
jgi:cytochrome c6